MKDQCWLWGIEREGPSLKELTSNKKADANNKLQYYQYYSASTNTEMVIHHERKKAGERNSDEVVMEGFTKDMIF